MPRKKTHEEFVLEMKSISPDVEILGQYAGRHEPIEVRCMTCGNVWNPSAGDLLSGKGCRQCRIKTFSQTRTKTNEQFLQELLAIKPDVEALTPYTNSHTKISAKCKTCGNIWEITPKDLLHGYGCRNCAMKRIAEKRKISDEDFCTRVLQSNPNIELLGEYKSLQDNIAVRCKKCGKRWSPRAANILYGNGCPRCSIGSIAATRRKSQKQFEDEVNQILPTVTVVGTYKGLNSSVECKCEVCGFAWDALPESLLNGHGCRRCSRSGTSFMEQYILHSFSDVLGEDKVLSRNRSAIGMELDIYIPSFCFAIEPGSWAFHKNSIARDEKKRALCKDNGIRLITVYDSFPIDQAAPFKEDCIVFDEDYNGADHSYIRKLVTELFELAGVSAMFTEKQWQDIERRAYQDARAKNTEDFIQELSIINTSIEILGTYIGSKIPIEARCKKCGHEWKPRPASLLNGSGCPLCAQKENTKRQTKSHDQYVEELKTIQPSITIIGRYTKGKDHIDAKCDICGTEWRPVAASLLNGEGCPTCGLIKKANGRRKTQEEYEAELYLANPNIEVVGIYTGTTDPILVRCKVCGYEWSRVARKLIENPHHRNEKEMHSK